MIDSTLMSRHEAIANSHLAQLCVDWKNVEIANRVLPKDNKIYLPTSLKLTN